MRLTALCSVLLSAAALAACGSAVPTSPSVPATTGSSQVTPPSPASSSTSGLSTVEGAVFDSQTGPIANASINLWVQQERSGYSYWWAHGPLRSGADGRYVAPNVPDSQISVFAVKDGYVQPCSLRAEIRGGRTLDVEMISRASLDVISPPLRPHTIPGPPVTGFTFETIDGVRQPVGGVDLWVGDAIDNGVASSVSNRRGEFFLCNLPKDVYIYASKSGYEPTEQQPIDTSGMTPVGIELKRR